MKVLLPYHLGCGNRGCEGIARGISKILDLDKEQLILFDISQDDYFNDKELGLDQVGELKYTKQNKGVEIARLVSRAFQKINFSYFYNQLMSSYYVNQSKPGDMIFITGGDIYCYENAAALPNLIAKKAKRRGLKTVLFGVSMERKFLDEKVVDGLRNFDLITTRETISSNTLNSLGLKNYLYPDPAFFLAPTPCTLPVYFNKTVVGINFSPFTDNDILFRENIDRLIEYILSKGMDICFIPHVFWKDQDDRTSIRKYAKKYQGRDRVHILNSESMSYLEIRYAISKCKYFIGGRTHSVISAYSVHVPCIALGYSVKARGIAKDIGMPEYTVIDSKNLNGKTELVDTFKKIEMEHEKIAAIYNDYSDYVTQLQGLKQLILE